MDPITLVVFPEVRRDHADECARALRNELARHGDFGEVTESNPALVYSSGRVRVDWWGTIWSSPMLYFEGEDERLRLRCPSCGELVTGNAAQALVHDFIGGAAEVSACPVW